MSVGSKLRPLGNPLTYPEEALVSAKKKPKEGGMYILFYRIVMSDCLTINQCDCLSQSDNPEAYVEILILATEHLMEWER